jgi:hypothetical protein
VIIRLNCLDAVALLLSVTCTVKLNVPGVVGTPFSRPVRKLPSDDSDMPGGRLPPMTAQPLYGVVPPEAARACEYGTPTVPFGRGDSVIIERPLPPEEVIVNVSAFDIEPPGFATVMLTPPAFVIRFAATVAVNCVAVT